MSDLTARMRVGYEAFNRGDYDAALEMMHPDIVWQRFDRSLEPEPLRGVEAVKELLVPDIFEEQEVGIEAIRENGDRVLVELIFRVRTARAGIELTNRNFHVWTIEGELAVRLDIFDDREEALAAAGLSAG
jgi:ketosteroid isomerase-like protein